MLDSFLRAFAGAPPPLRRTGAQPTCLLQTPAGIGGSGSQEASGQLLSLECGAGHQCGEHSGCSRSLSSGQHAFQGLWAERSHFRAEMTGKTQYEPPQRRCSDSGRPELKAKATAWGEPGLEKASEGVCFRQFHADEGCRAKGQLSTE